jgi:ankyrin repeat protein
MLLIMAAQGRAAESPSALADAAERGDARAVLALLDAGAEVDAPQADGMTALLWAALHDDAPLAAALVDAGADVNRANRYGVPPLVLACRQGDGALVRQLLEAGANPNAVLPDGATPLMIAARTGRIDAVRALVDHGAAVGATEPHGQTALMWAAAEGHADVVRALVDAGADVQTPLESGFTPLLFACREGRIEVVAALLDRGVDVNAAARVRRAPAGGLTRGATPLIVAIENGHFELAARLLNLGADATGGRAPYTPLHAIVGVRKVDSGDDNALPPPDGSGQLTSLDLVRRLVEHGADVNAQLRRGDTGVGKLNRRGATPFFLAADTADAELMRLLVELGADPTITNADRATALLAAAGLGTLAPGEEAGTEEEALEAVQLCLELGLDVNAVDDNGETAMHGAAYASWPRMVQFLAEHGADEAVWNRRDKYGWTPLLIARGYRPGNFKPAPDTIAALRSVMHDPHAPDDEPPKRPENYSQ